MFVQGRRFSVAGLLGDAEMARQFDQSSMLIFRLAPQGVFKVCPRLNPFTMRPCMQDRYTCAL